MIVKAGTNLIVNSKRKGTFKAVATRDFDTETEEFYPVATRQNISGMVNEWLPGEKFLVEKAFRL